MELKISPPKNIANKKDCYNGRFSVYSVISFFFLLFCAVSNGEGEKCSIELGLNVELSNSKYSTNGYGFTFLQRQELEQQFSIYKYIDAGQPVPSHLIVPICKSFTCSLKGLHDGNSSHYLNLIGYGHVCSELKSSMEPEPRRCRRTDGRKWRCSKGVLQNQKYCEKHMHRGRQRSRKCVEPASSNFQLSSNCTVKIKSNSTMRIAAQAHQNSEPDTSTFSIALPIN